MHASILKYFVAVARSGSIRKASEDQHVAASALSRQIKKLEDELGVQLFERFADGLRLTHAGEIVRQHADSTMRGFDLMRSALWELQGQCTGTVRIACLDSLSVQFLPEFVLDFHRDNPAVDFRITNDSYTRIFELIAAGDCDIGITFDFLKPHDVGLVDSVPMPLMAMVAADHPLASQKSVSFEQCAQYKLLMQLDNEVMQSLISTELAALSRVGRSFVATNNQMMLKPLILSGEGLAFYTPLGLLQELEDGRIVALPLSDSPLNKLRMGVFVSNNRQLSHATTIVSEAMVGQLRGYAGRIGNAVPGLPA